MNTKLVVLLGSVGAIHLVAGGLFLAGGCTQEDPPMPPGIYVPKQPAAERTEPGPAPVAQPTTEPVSEMPPEMKSGTVKQEENAAAKTSREMDGSAAHGDQVYIVVKNDSLWLLARKNGLTVEELASYNNLPANARLKVGQKLYIPATGKRAVKAQFGAKAKSKAVKTPTKKGGKKAAVSKRANKKLPPDGIYTIKAGDNFSTIAKRFGLKVSDLIAANPGVESSRLKIGQKILLKPGAAALSAKTKTATERKSAAAGKTSADPVKKTNSAENKTPSKAGDDDDLLKDVKDVEDIKQETKSSNEAVKAVIPNQNDPISVVPDKDRIVTENNGNTAVVVGEDTTISAFCKKFRVSEDDIKKLNPAIAADGKIKTGTRIRLATEEN